MKAGRLVDDATVIELVRARIAAPDCLGGYILDGFPRTVDQARALEAIDAARPEIVLDLTAKPKRPWSSASATAGSARPAARFTIW